MLSSSFLNDAKLRKGVRRVSILVCSALAFVPILMGLQCPPTITTCSADADCDDSVACTDDTCDTTGTTGVCMNVDNCTGLDTCNITTGACDAPTCTTDADCVDTDPCNGAETCVANACVAGTPVCNDNDACTTDTCDPTDSSCTFTPIVCPNAGDTCSNGVCGSVCTVDGDCDDTDLCTADTCVSGVCVFAATDCDDTDACTTDSCDSTTGNCVNDPLCDDGDNCTTDTCTNGVCSTTTVECGQGQTCDTAGNCVDIVCTTNADCDDGFVCTTDTCISTTSTCSYTNIDAQCDDGQFCTGTGTCNPTSANAEADGCVRTGNPCANPTPVCVEGTDSCEACDADADCDDDITCTDDVCTPSTGVCTSTNNDANCPDLDFCDGVDVCDPLNANADADGCTQPGTPCPPVVNPTFGACNEATDACFECTSNADCSDGIPCTVDVCNDPSTGLCTNTADNTLCPDPAFCDGIDTCTPADPDADANGCLAPGTPCGGVTPICDEGTDTCDGCVSNAECDDGVDCTDDTCDGLTGACVFTDNCTGLLSCLGGADPTICD